MKNTGFELIDLAEKYGQNNITTIIKDGEPWFRGKDIATILGYKNVQGAIREHVLETCKRDLKSIHEGLRKLRGNEGKPSTFQRKE
jgi:prophage antirepressor-like protein